MLSARAIQSAEKHREHPPSGADQFERLLALDIAELADPDCDVQERLDFEQRAARYRNVVRVFCAMDAAVPFRDVGRNGYRRPADLIGERETTGGHQPVGEGVNNGYELEADLPHLEVTIAA